MSSRAPPGDPSAKWISSDELLHLIRDDILFQILEVLPSVFNDADDKIYASPSGAIAQLGERIVRNDEVVGSIPTSSTISDPLRTRAFYAV